MRLPRLLLASALLALTLTGCRAAPSTDGVASAPPKTAPADSGLLLQTGAIQLGPGLGQNAYRWLGDGEWGFRQ